MVRNLRDKLCAGIVLGVACSAAPAATVYLPLDTPITADVRRLAAVSQLKLHSRPYPVEQLHTEAQRLSGTYPALSGRILTYLERYYRDSGVGSTTVEGHYSGGYSEHNVPQHQGDTTATRLRFELEGNWMSQELFKADAALRIDVDEEELNGQFSHGYLSLGWPSAQLDLGYRQHTYSPSPFGSPLGDSNPKPFPTLTLSNPAPLSWAGLSYTLTLGQLQDHETIMLGTQASPGNPYIATTHINIAPASWVEWGLSRTFVFGGGERSVSVADFAQAFFDPRGKDNVGLGSCSGVSPNCEFGNQQIVLSSAFKLDFRGTPFVVYSELGAEDTARGSYKHFGNILTTVGLYLPWLSERDQLTFEYSEFELGWYTHHIYRDGLLSERRVVGTAWADLMGSYLGRPGYSESLMWTHDTAVGTRWQMSAHRAVIRTPSGSLPAYQARVGWRQSAAVTDGWFAAAIIGRTASSDSYAQLRGGYGW